MTFSEEKFSGECHFITKTLIYSVLGVDKLLKTRKMRNFTYVFASFQEKISTAIF